MNRKTIIWCLIGIHLWYAIYFLLDFGQKLQESFMHSKLVNISFLEENTLRNLYLFSLVIFLISTIFEWRENKKSAMKKPKYKEKRRKYYSS
ncbi:hypothetical protein MWH28_01560 [Natroniella sulfidigena]|uniref:hypothetical protein n=1 Tax=Natroniella sulfidigena TaxID=723921 RepID=UPI00200B4DE8|nr:hypothetical protein [Natroniella sulfidigena]MCK8816050.1 hypothetical protein [Natroniella sulfidigena]